MLPNILNIGWGFKSNALSAELACTQHHSVLLLAKFRDPVAVPPPPSNPEGAPFYTPPPHSGTSLSLEIRHYFDKQHKNGFIAVRGGTLANIGIAMGTKFQKNDISFTGHFGASYNIKRNQISPTLGLSIEYSLPK